MAPLWPNEQNANFLSKYTSDQVKRFQPNIYLAFLILSDMINSPYFHSSSPVTPATSSFYSAVLEEVLYGVVNRTQDRVRKPLVAHSSTIARP